MGCELLPEHELVGPERFAGDVVEFVFGDGGDLLVGLEQDRLLNSGGQKQQAHELVHAGRAQVEPAGDLPYIFTAPVVQHLLDLVGEDQILP